MPDLSSYINYSVQFDIRDKNAPVWLLTDTGVYPLGVAAGLSGIFEITQPDKGVYTGSWATPDIIYSAGALQPASISLRLATGRVLQPGTYIIKYSIDHALYTPTILTRTFTVAYSVPTAVLTEAFDVFVPTLSIADETDYVPSGYTTAISSRAWAAVVGTVGTVTGTSSTLNLAYLTNYYDAAYAITLIANFIHTSTVYSYLTIRDRLTTIKNTGAWTPPTATVLRGYLKTLKSTLDALVNSCQTHAKAKADYEYAYTLYMHIKTRVCAGDTIGVYTYIQEILDILHNHAAIPTTHTNAVIPAYNYGALCSTGNSLALFTRKVDGTELQSAVPSDHVTFTEVSLIDKVALQISLDGIIRDFSQGSTPPILPPADGEFYFQSDIGKVWYAPSYNLSQTIKILYYA